jgi:hypothetical protein
MHKHPKYAIEALVLLFLISISIPQCCASNSQNSDCSHNPFGVTPIHICGKVLDGDGHTIEGARITFFDADGGPLNSCSLTVTKSDSAGAFDLTGSLYGSGLKAYCVFVTSQDGVAMLYNPKGKQSITLKPSKSALFRFVDDLNNPLSNVFVRADQLKATHDFQTFYLPPSVDPGWKQRTNSDGVVVLSNLPSGYDLLPEVEDDRYVAMKWEKFLSLDSGQGGLPAFEQISDPRV